MTPNKPYAQPTWLILLCILLAACSSPTEYETTMTWSPVQVDSEIEGNKAIEAIIAPYKADLDAKMNEVIGYAAHDLTSRGGYESDLGTFVTKLLLTQSRSVFKTEVDVAIMNHRGGLRAPINEGPITLGEVFEVMPFENEMRLIELTGDQLMEVIRHVGKSGRSMIWPVRFSVANSVVSKVSLNGKAIVPDQTYVLAISDYLANGGGGFNMLTDLKRIEVTPALQRDFIVNEIRQKTAQGDSIDTKVANLVTVADQ